MKQLILRLLHNISTYLVVFYAKKAVFYIDRFFVFAITENESKYTCTECGESYRASILERMYAKSNMHCPNCGGNKFLLEKKSYNYERKDSS